jgi:AcrR family transcriptional regulator
MLKNLSAGDWIDAGLKRLAGDGFTALKADVIARTLKVSRGSFYWHFADIAAFEDAVMQRWRDVMAEAIIRDLESVSPARERLPRLLRLVFDADGALEIAMRGWAASDPRARAVVRAVDNRRLAYLQRMLRESGVTARHVKPRAQILYWSYLGFVLSAMPVAGEARDRLIGELAALGGDKG